MTLAMLKILNTYCSMSLCAKSFSSPPSLPCMPSPWFFHKSLSQVYEFSLQDHYLWRWLQLFHTHFSSQFFYGMPISGHIFSTRNHLFTSGFLITPPPYNLQLIVLPVPGFAIMSSSVKTASPPTTSYSQ